MTEPIANNSSFAACQALQIVLQHWMIPKTSFNYNIYEEDHSFLQTLREQVLKDESEYSEIIIELTDDEEMDNDEAADNDDDEDNEAADGGNDAMMEEKDGSEIKGDNERVSENEVSENFTDGGIETKTYERYNVNTDFIECIKLWDQDDDEGMRIVTRCLEEYARSINNRDGIFSNEQMDEIIKCLFNKYWLPCMRMLQLHCISLIPFMKDSFSKLLISMSKWFLKQQHRYQGSGGSSFIVYQLVAFQTWSERIDILEMILLSFVILPLQLQHQYQRIVAECLRDRDDHSTTSQWDSWGPWTMDRATNFLYEFVLCRRADSLKYLLPGVNDLTWFQEQFQQLCEQLSSQPVEWYPACQINKRNQWFVTMHSICQCMTGMKYGNRDDVIEDQPLDVYTRQCFGNKQVKQILASQEKTSDNVMKTLRSWKICFQNCFWNGLYLLYNNPNVDEYDVYHDTMMKRPNMTNISGYVHMYWLHKLQFKAKYIKAPEARLIDTLTDDAIYFANKAYSICKQQQQGWPNAMTTWRSMQQRNIQYFLTVHELYFLERIGWFAIQYGIRLYKKLIPRKQNSFPFYEDVDELDFNDEKIDSELALKYYEGKYNMMLPIYASVKTYVSSIQDLFVHENTEESEIAKVIFHNASIFTPSPTEGISPLCIQSKCFHLIEEMINIMNANGPFLDHQSEIRVKITQLIFVLGNTAIITIRDHKGDKLKCHENTWICLLLADLCFFRTEMELMIWDKDTPKMHIVEELETLFGGWTEVMSFAAHHASNPLLPMHRTLVQVNILKASLKYFGNAWKKGAGNKYLKANCPLFLYTQLMEILNMFRKHNGIDDSWLEIKVKRLRDDLASNKRVLPVKIDLSSSNLALVEKYYELRLLLLQLSYLQIAIVNDFVAVTKENQLLEPEKIRLFTRQVEETSAGLHIIQLRCKMQLVLFHAMIGTDLKSLPSKVFFQKERDNLLYEWLCQSRNVNLNDIVIEDYCQYIAEIDEILQAYGKQYSDLLVNAEVKTSVLLNRTVFSTNPDMTSLLDRLFK